jgi:hypothetical protein
VTVEIQPEHLWHALEGLGVVWGAMLAVGHALHRFLLRPMVEKIVTESMAKEVKPLHEKLNALLDRLHVERRLTPVETPAYQKPRIPWKRSP